MKRYITLLIAFLSLISLDTQTAYTKDWGYVWLSSSEHDKALILAGYRIAISQVCSQQYKMTSEGKIICLANQADDNTYIATQHLIDEAYRREKYKYINIENTIHLSILYLLNKISIDDFDKLLNIFSDRTDPDKQKMETYRKTISSLLLK